MNIFKVANRKRDECLKREIEREKRAGGVVLDGL